MDGHSDTKATEASAWLLDQKPFHVADLQSYEPGRPCHCNARAEAAKCHCADHLGQPITTWSQRNLDSDVEACAKCSCKNARTCRGTYFNQRQPTPMVSCTHLSEMA